MVCVHSCLFYYLSMDKLAHWFSLRVVTQALFEKVTKFAACQCIADQVLFIRDVSVPRMKRF